MAHSEYLHNSLRSDQIPASIAVSVFNLRQIRLRESFSEKELLIIKARANKIYKKTEINDLFINFLLFKAKHNKIALDNS